MKKTIIAIFALATVITSCADSGKEAVTKEAGKVVKVENHKTQKFTKIKPGSHVNWRASHLGGMQKRFGTVQLGKASFMVNDNKLTNALVSMNMGSLTVESFPEGSEQTGKLTGHLKSADFFDVKEYPNSLFELVSVEPNTGKYNSKVTGNLTMKGITKSITFAANINVSDNAVTIKSEDFSVDRTDWGLKYNVEGTEGVPVDYLIANPIGFTIDVTVTK